MSADNRNGYMGNREFGNINIQYHHGVPNSGVGEFEFCLVAVSLFIDFDLSFVK